MDAPMEAPEDAPPPQVTQIQTQVQTRPESGRAAGGARANAVAFTSAKMMDAQGVFQRVVKQELQVLLGDGVKREDAVRMLLHRIVESTDAPEPAAVRSVMRQFQMNYDDAVRALIVKQELGRLKRKGMDSFAAIEELTRKMQRIPVPSDTDTDADASPSSDVKPSEVVDESSDENARAEEAVSSLGVEDTKEATVIQHAEGVEVDAADAAADNGTGDAHVSAAIATDDGTSAPNAVVVQVDQDEGHAQDEEGAEKDVEKQLNLSSLTLCQRIDKVSISSAATRASLSGQLKGDDSPGATSQDAGTQSPRPAAKHSSASASTPPPTSHRHTRKRRAPFGLHGRSNSNGSDGSISPERHVTISSSLSNRSHDLYPSVKKQKLCEVGDGFLSMLSRKAKHQTPPESPAASSSDTTSVRTSGTNSAAGESPTRGASKNLVKRPRSSHGMVSALIASDSDDDSPILEHDDVLLIRHLRHRAKRHKSAVGSSTASDNSSSRLHAQPASP